MRDAQTSLRKSEPSLAVFGEMDFTCYAEDEIRAFAFDIRKLLLEAAPLPARETTQDNTQVPTPIVSLTLYINRYRVVCVTNAADPDAERFLPLKPNWFHVLLSLANEEQHGYGIMQEVLERTNGKIRLWPATLYGTLERLLDEGLIAEASRRPPADEDDVRRRYYRLTVLGRRVLAAESIRLEDLVRVIRAKRRAAASEA